jgi:hypothetical protein
LHNIYQDAETRWLSTNAEESAKVLKDHFEKNVFNRNEESSFDARIFNDPIQCDPKLGEAVTPRFNVQSKKMKTEKAIGKNGLPPEAFTRAPPIDNTCRRVHD